MVPEEGLDASARAPGLFLEPHEEVERLAHLGAAVEDVTRLHEDRRPPDPLPLGVDEARGLQDFHELIERAVHVPDGDDARAWRLDCGRRRRLEGREHVREIKTSAAAANTGRLRAIRGS